MKNLLNYKSLIKVAIMIVVIALIGSQVMDTDAARRNNRGGTTGGGQDGGNKGKAECPTCCDAWDKQLGEDRFVLVMPTEANPDGEAVLDKETCLVWEQSPDTTIRTWLSAPSHCFTRKVGGRYGWRAPTVEELATLLDDTEPVPNIPSELKTLTSNVQSFSYWSSTTANSPPSPQDYGWDVDFNFGNVGVDGKEVNFFVWCVRGGQGNEAY